MTSKPRKLSVNAQALHDALSTHAPGEWVDPFDLETATGMTYFDRCTYCASLTRRGLVERNREGFYRLVAQADAA